MKLKWTSLTLQQEKKNGAILLIVIGLYCLLRGPALLVRWGSPGAENAFEKIDTQLMIAGGVMLIAGVAMAWHIWWKRKPS
jgi:hypothetical protein